MKKFKITFSDKAYNDLSVLVDVITFQYKSPITAFKYGNELKAKIKTLEHSAESFKIETDEFYNLYGNDIRRINYKKMAILYSINENNVLIQRVIPANLIK